MKYIAEFILTNEIENVVEANEYLQYDDMTRFLNEKLKEFISKITWIVTDTTKGYVEIITNREMTEDELYDLDDWIRGQNSDGLGEGFEQRFYSYILLKSPDDGGFKLISE